MDEILRSTSISMGNRSLGGCLKDVFCEKLKKGEKMSHFELKMNKRKFLVIFV